MNTKTLKIGRATVKLTDKDYVASGGQAAVYKHGDKAVKIYHEPSGMLPVDKIRQLSTIVDDNVVRPLEIVFNEKGDPVGYTMRFLTGTEPICRLFTKAFKLQHGVETDDLVRLNKDLHLHVRNVHAAGCLVVDLNELNVLVDDSFGQAFIIDTDSFQTPSHPATAIMESVRDRSIPRGKFGTGSDWFAFAVTTFTAYTNVHPFRGVHPDYRPADWSRRMDDGVSVFDRGVRLPPVAAPFTVIPPRQLDWYRNVFSKGERSEPPMADSTAPVQAPAALVMLKGGSKFQTTQIYQLGSPAVQVLSLLGFLYFATKTGVYAGNVKLPVPVDKKESVHLLSDSGGNLLVAIVSGQACRVVDSTGTKTVARMQGSFFSRDGRLYSVSSGGLIEHVFLRMGSGTLHSMQRVENVYELSARTFDGMLVQVLLGKHYLTVPYASKKCCNVAAPVLDGRRVVDAKSSGSFAVVVSEKGGKFNRTGFAFDAGWKPSVAFNDEDIAYDAINFCAYDKLGCLLSSPDTLRLFSASSAKEYDNPPLDSSMKLFTHQGALHFINGESVFHLGFT